MNIFKIRYKDTGGHIQVRWFSGLEGFTLTCNGTLAFTRDEFSLLKVSMHNTSECGIIFEEDGSGSND